MRSSVKETVATIARTELFFLHCDCTSMHMALSIKKFTKKVKKETKTSASFILLGYEAA
jgi:hypothetical protein